MENICIEGKVETLSQVSILLATQESLSKELEEIMLILAIKDTGKSHIKLQNQKLYIEGPGTTKDLAAENINF